MSKKKSNSYLSDLELEQVMYNFPVLVDEMKHARKYFLDHINGLDDENLSISSTTDSDQTIVRHIGYLGYFEKEAGKKVEIPFSYRMDVYDQIFCDLSDFVEAKELPNKIDLMRFLDEVHETFMNDLRFIKKTELLYSIINLHYSQTHEIRLLLKEANLDLPEVKVESKMIDHKSKDKEKLYYLPMYTN